MTTPPTSSSSVSEEYNHTSHPINPALPRPRRILVIGGGPTGLVALRNLIRRGGEGAFDRVELVERRDDVGGAWYLEPSRTTTTNGDTGERCTVAGLNPQEGGSEPEVGGSGGRWPSPAYPGLIGNVLPTFLSFSEYPFLLDSRHPLPEQPFPTLEETHSYLKDFARPFVKSGVVRLGWEVVGVEEMVAGDDDQCGFGKWKVSLRNWNSCAPSGGAKETQDATPGMQEEIWDAVVIAVGWYDNPVWPRTDGLEDLKAKRPDVVRHAKWWRSPQGYEGKKVVVVGNGNSANDVAAHLAPVVNAPLYQSIRRPAFPGFVSLPDERIAMVPPVKRYIVDELSAVMAELEDGTKLENLDVVVFGTGYHPFAGFVRVREAGDLEGERTLVPLMMMPVTDHRVPSLHRHILYARNPTLAFIGAPMAYTPFQVADTASTWLTLAWGGEIGYPETVEGRLVYERARMEEVERMRKSMQNPSSLMVYGTLGSGEQDYAGSLKEEVVEVRPELKNVLSEWSDERTRMRDAMFKTKFDALKAAKDFGNVE